VALLTREGEGLGGDEVDAALLDATSTLGSGTRVIATWPLPDDGRLPDEEALCVYLHGVGDPGNVGSILRSAGALVDAWVAVGPECADPYGPKAIRATMGAIFNVPVRRCQFEATPSPRISLVAHGGAPEPATDARTICLGSERDGLPQAIVDSTDASWTIPMRSGAVESLGVAAAAAIALSRIGSRVGGESP